jgi:transcriptional regulator with XRE-family HTH domain
MYKNGKCVTGKDYIMAKGYKPPGHEERLQAFAQRLNRLLLAKGWGQADLAREATKHVPKSQKDKDGKPYVIGRHIVSAYARAANEPTGSNLLYISKALGVKPDELLQPVPGAGADKQYASATTTLDGKTRLVIDAEVESEVAMKVLALVRGAVSKKGETA